MRAIRAALAIGIVGVLLAVASGPASAGPIIDPNTLTPPPPDGSSCRADGAWAVCHTVFVEDLVNEPIFDLPCGTVYQTSHDPRTGLRWYFDDLLVRRHVFSSVSGTWSLSPDGAGPTIAFVGHPNWIDIYAVPGDPDTAVETLQGDELTVFLPGRTLHVAGIDIDEEHRGVLREISDPEAASAVCGALAA